MHTATSLRPITATARRACQLLLPGDEVSLSGSGRFAVIHLAHSKAWLEGADGRQLLADASDLQLLNASGTGAALLS